MHFRFLTALMLAALVAGQSLQSSQVVTRPSSTPTAPSSLPPTASSSMAAQPTTLPGGAMGNQPILQYLEANSNDSTVFVEVLNNLGPNSSLVQALNSTGNYTVFVPTDQAIMAANQTLINSTYGGVQNVIAYHVLNQTIFSQNITEQPMFFNTLLNNATVSKYPNNTGLPLGLVQNTQAQDVNGNNGASNGTGQFQVGYGFDQTANVTMADVGASNGVIHYVDSVLLPPASPSDTLATKDQVSMLVSAAQNLNLTDTINNASGITLFAPTNAAMQQANLSQYDNQTLAAIIQNHVVQGIYFTSNITGNETLTSLDGGNLTVSNITTTEYTNMTNPSQQYTLLKRLFTQDSGTEYSVNNATIVDKNVLTDNGVIHIINQVLIPNMTQNGTMGNGTNGTGPHSAAADFSGSSWTALLVALSISLILI